MPMSVMQPNTVGAAMDMDSYVFKLPNYFHPLHGVLIGALPNTIINKVFNDTVRGVDFPFNPPDYDTALEVKSFKPWLAQKLKAYHAGEACPLGIPLALAFAPPDTTPIEVGKLDGSSILPFHKFILRKKGDHSLRGMEPEPGRWVNYLNATTWSDYSCELLNEIQRHVLCSPNDGVTWDLWSQSEVLGYLNQRILRFYTETGLVRKRYTTTISTNKVDLPSDLLLIKRVAWNGVGLKASDPLTLTYGKPGWESVSGTPYTYIETPHETLSVTLVGSPSSSGTFDLIYVPKPPEMTSVCQNLPIPNMFTPHIKWGILCDMLKKEGPANDPQRAEYGENRFTEGIELAKLLVGGS